MQQVPADTSAAFQRRLDQAQVPAGQPERSPGHGASWEQEYCDLEGAIRLLAE